MNNKFFAIFTLITGVLCFVFAVATANGWKPLPTAQAASLDYVAVIPQDLPQNIEVVGELAVAEPPTVQLPEMVITAQDHRYKPAVNPGAARRRQSPIAPVQASSPNAPNALNTLESPTGLASDAALRYQPRGEHAVRGTRVTPVSGVFALPQGGIPSRKRETYVFDAK